MQARPLAFLDRHRLRYARARVGRERVRASQVRATSRRLDASRTLRGGWSHANTFRPCTARWRRWGRCCWHARPTSPTLEHVAPLRPGSAPAERATAPRPVLPRDDASGRARASSRERERRAPQPARPQHAEALARPSSRPSRPSSRPSPRWRPASPPSCPRHRDRYRHRDRWWRWSCHPCTPWPLPGRGREARTVGSRGKLREIDAASESPEKVLECVCLRIAGRDVTPPARIQGYPSNLNARLQVPHPGLLALTSSAVTVDGLPPAAACHRCPPWHGPRSSSIRFRFRRMDGNTRQVTARCVELICRLWSVGQASSFAAPPLLTPSAHYECFDSPRWRFG